MQEYFNLSSRILKEKVYGKEMLKFLKWTLLERHLELNHQSNGAGIGFSG